MQPHWKSVPRTGEPSLEKQEFHHSSRTGRRSQGVSAGSQEGGDDLRLPGTLTDHLRPGRARHTPRPSSLKGCSLPGWTREQLRGGSGRGTWGRGLLVQGSSSEAPWVVAPHRRSPQPPGAAQMQLQQRLRAEGAAQLGAPIGQRRPGSTGRRRAQPRIRRSPGYRQRPGGHRTARTLLPQVEQISGPAPRASRPLQTESSVVIAGADSRAPGLAAATVVVPTGASQDKKTPLSLTVPSLYKQFKHLSLSPEPGRGLSSSPKC